MQKQRTRYCLVSKQIANSPLPFDYYVYQSDNGTTIYNSLLIVHNYLNSIYKQCLLDLGYILRDDLPDQVSFIMTWTVSNKLCGRRVRPTRYTPARVREPNFDRRPAEALQLIYFLNLQQLCYQSLTQSNCQQPTYQFCCFCRDFSFSTYVPTPVRRAT